MKFICHKKYDAGDAYILLHDIKSQMFIFYDPRPSFRIRNFFEEKNGREISGTKWFHLANDIVEGLFDIFYGYNCIDAYFGDQLFRCNNSRNYFFKLFPEKIDLFQAHCLSCSSEMSTISKK